MADLTIWISGADFIKIKSFFAPEGRRLFEMGEFLAEEGAIFLKLLVVYPLLRLPPFTFL